METQAQERAKLPMISDGMARRIASDWHGGQWSALNAFASSGATVPRTDITETTCARCDCSIELIAGTWVVYDPDTSAGGLSFCPPDPDSEPEGAHIPSPDDLLREIERAHGRHTEHQAQRAELLDLYDYVKRTGWRGPVAGWSSVWE